MKRSLFYLALILLLLTGCSNTVETDDTADIEYENKYLIEEMTDAFFDKDYSLFEEKSKEIQERYPDSMDYEMAQVYLDMYKDIKVEEETETENINYKDYIQLLKVWTSNPNSAGGIDLHIKWKNVSDKTVKYAYFECDLYNAVDDRVSCDIRDYYTFRGKITGPIAPGTIYGDNVLWETAWYNNSGKYPKVIGIELEYMDGTRVTIPQNKMDELFY